MKPEIGRLDPDCIQAIWPDVRLLLEDLGEDLLRTYDEKELFCNVLTGTYDLWLVTLGDELKLIGFCAWEKHAKRQNYHVIWVGGAGLELLKEAVIVVEQYACMNGASELIFGGRAGWGRLLKPLGFVPQAKWSKSVETCWKH